MFVYAFIQTLCDQFKGPTPKVQLLSCGNFSQNISRQRISCPHRHKLMETGVRNFAFLETFERIREGCTAVLIDIRKGKCVHREVAFFTGCHSNPTVFDFTRCHFVRTADEDSQELKLPCVVSFTIGSNRVAEDFGMVLSLTIVGITCLISL